MKGFNTELFLKILTAVLALAGLLYAWLKDLQLKRKTYADKIRDAAGSIIAKLERRKSIVLSLYQELQPIVTDIDMLFVKTKDVVATRDQLWKDINTVFLSIQSKMLDEEIEIAYVNLMGYQPGIMKLYQDTVQLLKGVDHDLLTKALKTTQKIILAQSVDLAEPAFLGNLLRDEMHLELVYFEKQIDLALMEIDDHLLQLIRKTDNAIYAKN